MLNFIMEKLKITAFVLGFLFVVSSSGCATIGDFLGFTPSGHEKNIEKNFKSFLEIACIQPFNFSQDFKDKMKINGIDIDLMCSNNFQSLRE